MNVLAVATDISAFRSRVDAALDEMNLRVISVQNAEPFDRRILTSRLDPDFVQLAREARESGEVCFDTFDMYPEEE